METNEQQFYAQPLETIGARTCRRHSSSVQCPGSVIFNSTVIVPFGTEVGFLNECLSCSEPQEFILVSGAALWSSVWDTEPSRVIFFDEFDISLICSCLETDICVRSSVSAFSMLKIRMLCLAKRVFLGTLENMRLGPPQKNLRVVDSGEVWWF